MINKLVTLVVVFSFCLEVRADVINLVSSNDTSIIERFPNNNMGGHTHVASGTDGTGNQRRGLYFFDIADNIPSGATINTVTLSLVVTASGGVSSTFDLFQLLAPWGEGTQTGNNGAPAQAGDATWNSNRVGVSSWSAPGGAAGTDFAASASASTLVNGIATFTWSSSTMASDVQTWLDTPAGNNGWILISESEATSDTATRFSSREDSLNQPSLAIDFSPIPEPSTWALLAVGALLIGRATRKHV